MSLFPPFSPLSFLQISFFSFRSPATENVVLQQYNDHLLQLQQHGSKPSSWMKDAHDVPKTVGLFPAIGVLYLLGVLVVGFVTHRQKLKEIREEVRYIDPPPLY